MIKRSTIVCGILPDRQTQIQGSRRVSPVPEKRALLKGKSMGLETTILFSLIGLGLWFVGLVYDLGRATGRKEGAKAFREMILDDNNFTIERREVPLGTDRAMLHM